MDTKIDESNAVKPGSDVLEEVLSEDCRARIEAAFSQPDEQVPESAIGRFFERLSKRISHRHILRLLTKRTRVMYALRHIPERMQKVTNQARLVLELIDDFAEGSYHAIPWHALAIAAATLLYSVSPADVIPDAIPALGALDDMVVVAIGMRLVRKHLQDYCVHKGYDPAEYF